MTDVEICSTSGFQLMRQATPMREEKIRRLERQALYEECLCCASQDPLGAFRRSP